MTEEKPKRNNNRNSNRRRNNSGSKSKNNSNKGPSSNTNNKKNNSRRRNNSNRNRNRNQKNNSGGGKKLHRIRVKDLGPSALIKRYGQLWEQHEHARKKYFEMFNRVGERNRQELEAKFVKTAITLRKFEENMEDWQSELMQNHFCYYEKDLSYTEKNNIVNEGECAENAPFKDPHILESQKGRPSYEQDTEESVGTLEDFQKYKEGLSA